jgi:hypothetical protein
MYRGVAGLCFATILFVCGANGFPIAPDARPGAVGQLTVTQGGQTGAQVFEGRAVQVSGAGYLPGSNVTIALYSSPTTLGGATTDAQGAFTVSVTIPASGARGQHTLTAIGLAPDQTARVLDAGVEVIAVPTTPMELARTGVNVALWVGGGLASLVSGLVLVRTAAMRRRLLPIQ